MAIDSLQSLREHLQWALQLEHATIPPYLCALYSMDEERNADGVEVIQSIVVEEMLHMTLAANILNAIGGEPRVDSPDMLASYPTYLPHSNNAFLVSLEKFSPQAIETFMLIERPAAHDAQPEEGEFETIGQFYEAIELALTNLTEELGEEAVFCGDPARQVTDKIYYGGGGRIITVNNLESALKALDEIVEQGEGLQHQEVWDGDQNMFHHEREEVAHYFRFEELVAGRSFQRGDTPQSGPTGEPVSVDFDAVHNFRPNPRNEDYPAGSEQRELMEEFNRTYCTLLHLLDRTYNGSPSLLAVATGFMYGIREQMQELMRMPSGDGVTTVGPSFEYVAPEQRHWLANGERRIVVVPNGPYLVLGDIPLTRKRRILSDDDSSISWNLTERLETEPNYALCRCGRSGNKPFCDGTHAGIGFDGTETAEITTTEERRKLVPGGEEMVVHRDMYVCVKAAFCVGRERPIPKMLPDSADSDVRAQVMGMIDRCPSGSYTYALTDEGPDVEADLPFGIAVTGDPDGSGGPLWVTGGIPVQRADREPLESRPRMTLCRCGQSAKKPLCDGTHLMVEFLDESAPPK